MSIMESWPVSLKVITFRMIKPRGIIIFLAFFFINIYYNDNEPMVNH